MTELRRKILDASVELVAERGVRGVSFREVARRAGVSHQAPYHHFGNHQGILEAIKREGFEGLAAAMKQASADAGPDPVQQLEAAGIAYVEYARGHVGHFQVMFSHKVALTDPAAELIAEAADTHGHLQQLCTEVQAAGYGLSLSHEDLVLLSWSTVHGFATLLTEGVLDVKHNAAAQADGLTRRLLGALSRLLA